MKIRLWIGKSRIHGKGVFAAQPITKGTRILQYSGEKIPKADTLQRLAQGNPYIFSFNDRYDIDGKALKNTARYINHSCDPNCAADITTRTIWIVARRDIHEGEELSYDYGYDLADYAKRPCTCGAKNCCGYMVDEAFRGKIQQKASAR